MAVSRGPEGAARWNSFRLQSPPDSTAGCDRGGQRQGERDLERARLRAGALSVIAAAQARRNGRPQHRGDRDRNDPERKLIETVGVVEPRHRRLRRRRHHGAGHQLELRNAARHHARYRLGEEPPHRRRQRERQSTRPHVEAQPRGADADELRDAGRRHRAGQQCRGAGRRLRIGEDEHEHDRDQHAIEDDDAERLRPHPAFRIQGRCRHGDDAAQRHVRHRQPHELDASGKRSPGSRKPGASEWTIAGANMTHNIATARNDAAMVPSTSSPKPRTATRTVLVANAHRHRHVGGIERAFGEQAPEQVRDLQRGEISVRQRSRAQHGGYAGIAQEAEQTRRQRGGADDGGDIAREGHAVASRSDITRRARAARQPRGGEVAQSDVATGRLLPL